MLAQYFEQRFESVVKSTFTRKRLFFVSSECLWITTRRSPSRVNELAAARSANLALQKPTAHLVLRWPH
jgi:hypothetical protein